MSSSRFLRLFQTTDSPSIRGVKEAGWFAATVFLLKHLSISRVEALVETFWLEMRGRFKSRDLIWRWCRTCSWPPGIYASHSPPSPSSQPWGTCQQAVHLQSLKVLDQMSMRQLTYPGGASLSVLILTRTSKSDSYSIASSLLSLNSSQVQTISWHRAGGGAGAGASGAGGADGGAGEENLIFRAAPQALVGRRWLVFWDLFLKPKRGNWRWSREVFRDKGVLLGKLVEAEGLWRGLARLSWVGGHGGYRPRLHETNKGLRSRSSSFSLTPNPHPSMTIDGHNFSFSFHSHKLVSSTNISWLFFLLLLVDIQSTLLDHIVTTCGAHLSCGNHLAPRRAMVAID